MPKKSDSVRGNKSDQEPSSMKDRERKPGYGEASYGAEDRQKKDHEKNPAGNNKNPFGPIGAKGESTGRDDHVFDGIGKLSGGEKSKNGCFPKLFMLLLSMAAGAVYFFFHM